MLVLRNLFPEKLTELISKEKPSLLLPTPPCCGMDDFSAFEDAFDFRYPELVSFETQEFYPIVPNGTYDESLHRMNIRLWLRKIKSEVKQMNQKIAEPFHKRNTMVIDLLSDMTLTEEHKPFISEKMLTAVGKRIIRAEKRLKVEA